MASFADYCSGRLQKRRLTGEEKDRRDAKLAIANAFCENWDYCMVFAMAQGKGVTSPEDPKKEINIPYYQSSDSKDCVRLLQEKNVDVFTYLSVQEDELYCLLRVRAATLRKFADKIKYPLEMDPDRLEAMFTGLESSSPDYKRKVFDERKPDRKKPWTPRKAEDKLERPKQLEADHPLTVFRHQTRFKLRNISDGSDLEDVHLNRPGDEHSQHKHKIERPSHLPPWELIFLPYNKDVPQQLYKHTRVSDNEGQEGKTNKYDTAATVNGTKYPSPSEPMGKLLSYMDRLKITYYYLRSPEQDGGCGIPIERMLTDQTGNIKKDEKKKEEERGSELKGPVLKAFFPLHHRSVSKGILKKSWEWNAFPWGQPIEELRCYYGEKFALFYVFVGHYSWWLLLPAIPGFLFQLVVVSSGDFSHPVLCFFGLVMSVWAIVMLQYWKRAQAYQALEWGMMDYEHTEPDRPDFYGLLVNSMVNGERILYFPENVSNQRAKNSLVIVSGFIALVMATVASIYAIKMQVSSMGNQSGVDGDSLAGLIAGVLNALQIQLLNMAYLKIADFMTQQENQRTDTQFEDSYIGKFRPRSAPQPPTHSLTRSPLPLLLRSLSGKLFTFQFINSYASFFYIAFVAQFLSRPRNALPGDIGQCGAPSCMDALALNLFIVFGTRVTVNNIIEYHLSRYECEKKRAEETKVNKTGLSQEGLEENMTPPEEDYLLLPTNPMQFSIALYADTAIQFGYVTLFVTALPAAPLCALVSNAVMIKVTTLKLVNYQQRPVPQGAQDIGTWESIFNILGAACVVTNAGLVSFTMNVLQRSTAAGQIAYIGGSKANANFNSLACVWIFITFSVFMFFLQYLCDLFIEDEPNEVTLQKERTQFFREKIIEQEPDDDDDDDKDESDSVPLLNSDLLAKINVQLEKEKLFKVPSEDEELETHPLAFIPTVKEAFKSMRGQGNGVAQSSRFRSKVRPFGGDAGKIDVERSLQDVATELYKKNLPVEDIIRRSSTRFLFSNQPAPPGAPHAALPPAPPPPPAPAPPVGVATANPILGTHHHHHHHHHKAHAARGRSEDHGSQEASADYAGLYPEAEGPPRFSSSADA